MLGFCLHNLERVDTVEHPQATEGAKVAGGVGSSGDCRTIPRTVFGMDHHRFGTKIILPEGMLRWHSGMETTSGGLRNSKPCP